MRAVLAFVFAFASIGLASTRVVAQSEPDKPPAKHRHVVKRPDPENATMPEKQDWIAQTLDDVLGGIDDLGKPLRDQTR